MQLQQFHYELPAKLIARFPLKERSASRLLCLNANDGNISHEYFFDLANQLQPNDLLVCNNSRVIPARLFGKKASGGRVEILVERILDDKKILAHVRSSKTIKPNQFIFFAENIFFEMIARHDNLFELFCHAEQSVHDVIEMLGEIPLPPYFHRAPEDNDKERYQTIYAKDKGSVAAPTAGLHFDQLTFEKLKAKDIHVEYVTLHVGAGTFAPVRVENIQEHEMHHEAIEVSEKLCERVRETKKNGGRIIAVGTTSARCLETASRSGNIKPFRGDTNIFIYPGFPFQCVDGLITNFHLPCSTLLMLTTAFGGYEQVMNAYREAIQMQYRFFSYGDAMLILK